ncbi:homeobox-leucine zipper protein PROTODERMAL FACTOR 2-like [Pyrus ussuriensis x Pyrus communis]|uniref:Homeobox-leucine zipper protein PROTODERMAL FACTOR 2-like n=1 Tax=Pyrus ussuriensis x Pyrus communis TaxID=2448454 RepID=A0A5N5G5X1_9ROSA|nr:homeobox-leucine zipper protein PROTODERMAL FACTOR 2-like [Pyrus ussuriensis x Pyrus communis]
MGFKKVFRICLRAAIFILTMVSYSSMAGEMYGAGDPLRSISASSEADKPMMIELAVAAMDELIRMAQMGEPLWMTSLDGSTTVLNEDEYIRTFPREVRPKGGFKTEASRESAVVIMNHMKLVEILMDVNQWSTVFSGIVSRALTLEVLSTGVAGNYNGALQVMTAEFQVPSPLVPTRESYYLRYCKQHADGTWAVVDVSLDNLRPNPALKSCQRRPSGCLIQEMPNGNSKQLVSSGHAFGAKRWVATLDRQCERLASAMASDIPTGDVGVITNQERRKSVLKWAERMVISFCAGLSASTTHTWTTMSGIGVDEPAGIVLRAAASFCVPVPPKRVFEFLRNEKSRSEWDILSYAGIFQEIGHIANGRDTGNCVSLLLVNSANSSKSNMLILQESCTDPTASFVIYAPVDIVHMKAVLNGSDPDHVPLLPSGFAILPDGAGIGDSSSGGSSLLTVAFQLLIDSDPTAKLSLGSSVTAANDLIDCTVEKIKAAFSCDSA